MGFFRKQDAPTEPEATVKTAVTTDPEKNAVAPQVTPAGTAIDPELEARVVRKLDWRVPTLLGFLCTLEDPVLLY